MKTFLLKAFRFITKTLSEFSIKRKIVLNDFSLLRRIPKNFKEVHHVYFAQELEKNFNPVTIVNIKNAYLNVTEGTVIKCMHIIEESLMDESFRNWYGLRYLVRAYISHQTLPGDRFIMVYNHYGVGYGHWLADVLPRLFVVKDELKNYKILLPDNYNTFHLRTLAPFGITATQIEYVKTGFAYLVPDLTIVSHVGSSCNTKDEILQELRSFYLDYYFSGVWPAPFRKIYISRSRQKNRKVINESEVEKLMIRAGFEIIYPEDFNFEQQVRLFGECRIMAGLTGSGLTNMLFMQRGGAVIEFKMKDDYQNLHYFSMSSGMELDYYYLICDVEGGDRLTADFHVNTADLKEILNKTQ